MKSLTKYIGFIFFLLLLISNVACKDENPNDPSNYIPEVNVNFYIYPNTIDFIEVGGFREYEDQGYRGVIVYRFDQTTFIAYEKTCPYDSKEETAMVQVHIPTFSLIDSTCMSSYNLVDGMPNGGPSSIALLQYGTYYDGNQLHIYN